MESVTNIVCVIDESGSMLSLKQQTIDGFNRFVEDQKKEPGKATLTLVKFSNGWRIPVKMMDLKHISPLQEIGYEPDGGTALLDALGIAIKTTGELLAADANVIFFVITDGEENSSTDYKLEQVKEMIMAREARGWRFIYLGANQDSFQVGANMGVASATTANFASNAAGVQASYGYASAATSTLRQATHAGTSVSDAALTTLKKSWKAKLEGDTDEQVQTSVSSTTPTQPSSGGSNS